MQTNEVTLGFGSRIYRPRTFDTGKAVAGALPVLKQFSDANGNADGSIDERLKLQAGLIQGGARSMRRFTSFAENSEERWVDLSRRVGELERKVDELGGKNAAWPVAEVRGSALRRRNRPRHPFRSTD